MNHTEVRLKAIEIAYKHNKSPKLAFENAQRIVSYVLTGIDPFEPEIRGEHDPAFSKEWKDVPGAIDVDSRQQLKMKKLYGEDE